MIDVCSSATRLIALLGDPVSHSVSPLFQNAAFREAGVDGIYLALRCERSAVRGLLRGIAAAGGGGNVTVPHKEIAASSVDRRTDGVERTGACNTYWCDDGVIWGDNTDIAGTSRVVEALLGASPSGARVLLLGAGGAARGALAALADHEVGEVVMLNRTPGKAVALAERFADAPFRVTVAASEDRLPDGPFDLVINATTLGLHPDDPPPLSLTLSTRIGAAFDMTYSAGGTTWLRGLKDFDIPALDGREMLLWQGAAAFERWWDRPAPIETMRTALIASADPVDRHASQ